MANTLLTIDQITKEAQVILHQNTTFIQSIFRGYDSSFAKTGAKIGDTLRVRLPNQYTVRTGAVASTQETTEEKVDLKVDNIAGVDLVFTAQDLTLSMDDFSERIIKPAVAVMAAKMEADAISMYKDVYQISDQDATAMTLLSVLQGGQILSDALAPQSDRSALLSTSGMVKILSGTSTLFNDQKELAKQYREGMMGRAAGFDFAQSSLILPHLTGTAAKTTGYTVNAAGITGSSVAVTGGTTTFLVGDIVTFVGCYRVHPETKVNTGVLQQFVITADSGGSASTLSISPAIVTSGARQNVSASPTNGGAVVKVGAGANEYLQSNLVYHKNAFAFATADIEPLWGLEHSRQTFEGISMSVHKYADGTNFTNRCRIDVLYGYKAIRPQLAARIHADG